VITRRRQIQVMLQLAGDILATAVSLWLAYWLRFDVEVLPITKGIPPVGPYLRLIPVAIVLFPAVFYFQGLYQGRRARSRFDEAVRVFVGVVLASAVLTGGLNFYREFSYSRLVLGIFAAVEFFLVLLARWVISSVLRRVRRSGGNVQNVLVVGAGELGRQVVGRLGQHREFGFRVVGFLDDDPGKQQRDIDGVPVLGTTHDLEPVISAHKVDQVLIALPLSSHAKTVRLIREAAQLLVEVKVVPDLLQYYVLRAGIEDLDGIPIINLTQMPLEGFNRLVKRAMDIGGALFGLALTAPAWPVIAYLIKKKDGGPVFFKQVRMGLDGRSFEILKFRSMRLDAEADGKAHWTRNRDSRVTPIGAFLRRTNLDELPQLINILRGDMSLVGPRPEQPEFVQRFRSRYPEYMARHRVRAGLTGWAQVNGLRGDTSIRKRMAADLYYIENWSLALDLRIIWLTFLSLWIHRGKR